MLINRIGIVALVATVLATTHAASANLVTNGSFESGSTGWTVLNLNPGFNGSFAWTSPPAPPDSGSTFFWGGNGGPGVASAGQLIDLTGNATAIDDGLVTMSASAWFAGFGQSWDWPQVDLYFLDAVDINASQLGVESIGGDTFFSSTWQQDAVSDILLPNGTRAIGVVLNVTGGLTGDRDGYIDLVNVTIDVVPEPASLALLGLGGLMILRRRR